MDEGEKTVREAAMQKIEDRAVFLPDGVSIEVVDRTSREERVSMPFKRESGRALPATVSVVRTFANDAPTRVTLSMPPALTRVEWENAKRAADMAFNVFEDQFLFKK